MEIEFKTIYRQNKKSFTITVTNLQTGEEAAGICVEPKDLPELKANIAKLEAKLVPKDSPWKVGQHLSGIPAGWGFPNSDEWLVKGRFVRMHPDREAVLVDQRGAHMYVHASTLKPVKPPKTKRKGRNVKARR